MGDIPPEDANKAEEVASGVGTRAHSGVVPAHDRVAELEATVAELSMAVQSLEHRLGQLEAEARLDAVAEHRQPSAVAAADSLEPVPSDATVEQTGDLADDEAEPSATSLPDSENTAVERERMPGTEELTAVAAVAGRTFLILGGAYLLRALTQGGTFGRGLGVSLALAYAGIWLFMAQRSAARGGSRLDSTAYGLAYLLVALPVIAEATGHFHLLSVGTGAAAVGVVGGLALYVAWLRSLRALAFIGLAAAVFAAAGGLLDTRAPVPFVLLFVGLGLGGGWVARQRGWRYLRATAVSIANLPMLVFSLAALANPEAYGLSASFVQLLYFASYMGTYSARALREKRSFNLFERMQASVVLVIGYLGAVLTARDDPTISLALGWAGVVLGTAAYATAYFMFVVPQKNRVDAWFNTSYPLVGVLAGSYTLLDEPTYAWMGIALLLAILGTRDRHAALPVHGAVFAILAALGSGLGSHVFTTFAAGASNPWPALAVPVLGALLVVAIVFFSPLENTELRRFAPALVGRATCLAVLVAGLGALLLGLTVEPLAGGVGPEADAGRVAALRTGVLASSALLLALASRVERIREAGLLVYPVLIFGGIKILAEDFPNGSPITLFVGFVLYGAALIVAPRLRTRFL